MAVDEQNVEQAAEAEVAPSEQPTPTLTTAVPTQEPTATDTPSPTATTKPSPTPSPTPTVVPGISRSAPLPLGSTVTGETWAITVSGVQRGAEANAAVLEANMFNDPPQEGWEYLIVDLELTNISEQDEAESADHAVSLKATGSRNVAYSSGGVVPPEPIEGDLFPGGTVTGQKVIQVPNDEDQLMLMVDEMWSFDSDSVRYVAIDEGASVSPDPSLSEVKANDTGTSRREPAQMGDTVITDEWEYVVTEVVRGAEANQMVADANMFNDLPLDGEEYLCVKLWARYLGGADPDETEMIDDSFLRVTGASNVIFERPSCVEPEPELDAIVFAGGEIEGWAVLSVPTDETGLMVVIEPLFSHDDDVRYVSIE